MPEHGFGRADPLLPRHDEPGRPPPPAALAVGRFRGYASQTLNRHWLAFEFVEKHLVGSRFRFGPEHLAHI